MPASRSGGSKMSSVLASKAVSQFRVGNRTAEEKRSPSQRRAKKLSQLHIALHKGSADAVWSAYLQARQSLNGEHHSSKAAESSTLGDSLTPEECREVLDVICNDATKTKRGLNRVLQVMSDVRDQQRYLLARLQHASETYGASQSCVLVKELEAWDTVVSPKLFNATIGLIGRSFRSVGLDEVDQILDQLLTYEANEQARMLRRPDSKKSVNDAAEPQHSAESLDHLYQSKRRGKQRQSNFPDLATYNTILDIMTRTVHRSDPARRSATKEEPTNEEEDDAMNKLTEDHLASRSAQLNASLASKLRRLCLDPDAAPLHLDAHERADRLFHSVLERMQRVSRIEPDHITFNIMITMYCLLDRWDAVHRAVRSAHDKGVLNIDCVNNAIGHWLVRGPASAKRLGQDRCFEHTATDTALEVYRQLRQNLVHAELASHHSEIAYGDRDSNSAASQDEDSLAELEPLSWPDRNERRGLDRSRNSATSTSNDAIEATLGIPRLPRNMVPDEITHALMINSLARDGRFADALSVFKDLVSTPLRLSAKGRKEGKIGSADEATDEKTIQPTLAIFDSFFRGFSRHGRPSAAVMFDAEYPQRSTWEAIPNKETEEAEEGSEAGTLQSKQDRPHAQQLQLWSIETFQQIFDAFLNLEPDLSQVLLSGAMDKDAESANRTISTPLGWLTLSEKRRMDALRRAPSTNQLFWILTAIRRVSNDHAGWSLAMWQKVVDKFEPHDAATSSSHDGHGWIGFRLDNRLGRVLEHLEARVAQEQEEGQQDPDITVKPLEMTHVN
ncbi:hypothetical protein NDA16_003972 [Ustilago loliicola]|nr:hypothetical protein NDA16_003972 [Ustilago loliicola]